MPWPARVHPFHTHPHPHPHPHPHTHTHGVAAWGGSRKAEGGGEDDDLLRTVLCSIMIKMIV